MVIDIQSDRDRADLLRLLSSADVVVTSQPPAVQRKLRLDHKTLRAEREDLVIAAISGFGLTGARGSDLP